jgi:hypothetical protein
MEENILEQDYDCPKIDTRYTISREEVQLAWERIKKNCLEKLSQ